MQSGTLWIWGGVAKSVATPFPEMPLVLGSVSVSWLRLFVLAAAALLIVVTYLLINRTKLGCAMRATFQDQDTPSLMGVNVDLIYTSTFAIGSSLAAAAGALLGPVYVIFPQMGDLAAVKAFAIVRRRAISHPAPAPPKGTLTMRFQPLFGVECLVLLVVLAFLVALQYVPHHW